MMFTRTLTALLISVSIACFSGEKNPEVKLTLEFEEQNLTRDSNGIALFKPGYPIIVKCTIINMLAHDIEVSPWTEQMVVFGLKVKDVKGVELGTWWAAGTPDPSKKSWVVLKPQAIAEKRYDLLWKYQPAEACSNNYYKKVPRLSPGDSFSVGLEIPIFIKRKPGEGKWEKLGAHESNVLKFRLDTNTKNTRNLTKPEKERKDLYDLWQKTVQLAKDSDSDSFGSFYKSVPKDRRKEVLCSLIDSLHRKPNSELHRFLLTQFSSQKEIRTRAKILSALMSFGNEDYDDLISDSLMKVIASNVYFCLQIVDGGNNRSTYNKTFIKRLLKEDGIPQWVRKSLEKIAQSN
ncbi:hypothetical protein BVX99_00200 [bacterium F16]|nr:hypothetical protein BVX99_00200 [bacterium F16]